jgi:DNA-binding NarL/FixJ family response regulator
MPHALRKGSPHGSVHQNSRVAGAREARLIGNAWTVKIRCVIVDDNVAYIEAARAVLDREGVEVVGSATNRAEAVRLVDALRPDVALVDVELGEESGFDLAEEIDSNRRATRVILISTHAEQDFAKLIEASPALGFVSKARLSASAIGDILDRADAA